MADESPSFSQVITEILHMLQICQEHDDVSQHSNACQQGCGRLSPSRFEDIDTRFRIWAGNSGALHYAEDPRSLDRRSRDAPEVMKRILDILEELRDLLRQAKLPHICGDQPTTDAQDILPDSDEDAIILRLLGPVKSSQCTAESLYTSLENTIQRLFTISSLIAKSVTQDIFVEAEARCNLQVYEPHDISHVKEKFTKTRGQSPWLADRLGRANTKRRQFIAYARLALPTDALADAGETGFHKEPSAEGSLKRTETFPPPILQTEASRILDEESGLSGNDFEDDRSCSSVVTSIVHDRDSSDPAIPELLQYTNTDDPVMCPMCHTPQRITNETSWKKHIFADLRAYVCTSRQCGLLMFDSSAGWRDHEMSHRRQWFCPICNILCSDDAETEKHLIESHGDMARGGQLEMLLGVSSRALGRLPAKDCPFCPWDDALRKRNPTISDDELVVPSRRFMKHVGRHLEELAIFVLHEFDGGHAVRNQSNSEAIYTGVSKDVETSQMKSKAESQVSPTLPAKKLEDARYDDHEGGRQTVQDMTPCVPDTCDSEPDPDDPLEPRYCYCLRGSYGDMVGCDNPKCEREWFHLGCTDLGKMLEEEDHWLCTLCQPREISPSKRAVPTSECSGQTSDDKPRNDTDNILLTSSETEVSSLEHVQASTTADEAERPTQPPVASPGTTSPSDNLDLLGEDLASYTEVPTTLPKVIYFAPDGELRDKMAAASRTGRFHQHVTAEKSASGAEAALAALRHQMSSYGTTSKDDSAMVADHQDDGNDVADRSEHTETGITASFGNKNATHETTSLNSRPSPLWWPDSNSYMKHGNDDSSGRPYARVPELSRAHPDSFTSSDGSSAHVCPYPTCGRHCKDLKAHMLSNRPEHPEKCPISTCDYYKKGFASTRKRDLHTLTHFQEIMVCGFCPRHGGSGLTAERSFNRVDVFKRHLRSVHGVERTSPNPLPKDLVAGICSTCGQSFANVQTFYDHLDACILRVTNTARSNEANTVGAIENMDTLSASGGFDQSSPSTPPGSCEPMSMHHSYQELCNKQGRPQDELQLTMDADELGAAGDQTGRINAHASRGRLNPQQQIQFLNMMEMQSQMMEQMFNRQPPNMQDSLQQQRASSGSVFKAVEKPPNGGANHARKHIDNYSMSNSGTATGVGATAGDGSSQNPPCNTLYVGNLPIETSEDELKALFSSQSGYKRLCFRKKSSGPVCFVEFDKIVTAERALRELYGIPLRNSTKGGIRLTFAKNPLGVRSETLQKYTPPSTPIFGPPSRQITGHPPAYNSQLAPALGSLTHSHREIRRHPGGFDREYSCGWHDCEKSYGTLEHLNAHVTMEAHGFERPPEEFKQLRRAFKGLNGKEHAAKEDSPEAASSQSAGAGISSMTADETKGPSNPPENLKLQRKDLAADTDTEVPISLPDDINSQASPSRLLGSSSQEPQQQSFTSESLSSGSVNDDTGDHQSETSHKTVVSGVTHYHGGFNRFPDHSSTTTGGNMSVVSPVDGHGPRSLLPPPPMQQLLRYSIPQPNALPDRPFRCDQCRQRFNRSHDLKRHKRIHLAVKPFPCGHCDKSFSRQDALERHVLVKGCGKSLSQQTIKSIDGEETDQKAAVEAGLLESEATPLVRM